MKSNYILQLFLGLVFCCAGLYRIFFWSQALLEIEHLHLPLAALLSTVVVFLEIGGGLLLLCNRYVRQTLAVFAAFIILALMVAAIVSLPTISATTGALFTFHANATDWFLHFTYLIILVYLLRESKGNPNRV